MTWHHPDSESALYTEALALYEQSELASAALLFERLLAVSPGHVEARYKLGNVRKEQGDWDAATGHYREVLRLDPGHAEAINNLGAVYQVQGLLADAERCYRQAMAHKPELTQPYANLGRLLQAQERNPEASAIYARALQLGLEPDLFGHLQAAVSGATSERAPQAYVRETFDAFAGDFDRHLVDDLEYRVPWQLAALLRARLGEARLDVLDLGCGTGQAGDALGSLARSLVGVDLSSQMLEVARRKGRYSRLHEADISDWLATEKARSFDLVVAADVFIYLGDLEPVFAGVTRCLRSGGLVAFSVESCAGENYRLLTSGRYAQSARYLQRLAARHGLVVLDQAQTMIRLGVAGELYLLKLT